MNHDLILRSASFKSFKTQPLGSILLIVLLILSLTSLLISNLLDQVQHQATAASHYQSSLQSFYAAQFALKQGEKAIQRNQLTTQTIQNSTHKTTYKIASIRQISCLMLYQVIATDTRNHQATRLESLFAWPKSDSCDLTLLKGLLKGRQSFRWFND